MCASSCACTTYDCTQGCIRLHRDRLSRARIPVGVARSRLGGATLAMREPRGWILHGFGTCTTHHKACTRCPSMKGEHRAVCGPIAAARMPNTVAPSAPSFAVGLKCVSNVSCRARSRCHGVCLCGRLARTRISLSASAPLARSASPRAPENRPVRSHAMRWRPGLYGYACGFLSNGAMACYFPAELRRGRSRGGWR